MQKFNPPVANDRDHTAESPSYWLDQPNGANSSEMMTKELPKWAFWKTTLMVCAFCGSFWAALIYLVFMS